MYVHAEVTKWILNAACKQIHQIDSTNERLLFISEPNFGIPSVCKVSNEYLNSSTEKQIQALDKGLADDRVSYTIQCELNSNAITKEYFHDSEWENVSFIMANFQTVWNKPLWNT